ncbi:ABC transporter ATP-binding protein [Micromonospora sp. RTGN7]|uniref:ABC transporter ATP-binding protein n=1 Tax=Micromonospora sp. RTGN7 TaxID=3016526 RepID=UPI0029FEEAEE|nr:ABC transporter ATP-binding protein [Micromonospora sp. RTGN7]
MLRLNSIRKSFDGPKGERVDVLRDLSVHIRAGTTAAILGRSGSGKSTLLAILGLLDSPDSGTYHIGGQEVSGLSDVALARLRSTHLGFVYQRFFLLPHLSAYENVETALQHGIPVPRRRRRSLVLESLDQVGLADRTTHRPRQLSGGEQQRVAIARALVRTPAVVLADEPTGALDENTSEQVITLLLTAAKARGATTVMVTHDPEVAMRTDRTLHLVEGAWARD